MRTILNQKNIQITVGQTEITAFIQIYSEFDDCWFGYESGDTDEDQRIEALVNRGDLTPVCIFVEAQALGLTGSDCLGGCLVSSPDDWKLLAAEHGMEANAITELTNGLLAIARAIKP
jgi:hypothetical protein